MDKSKIAIPFLPGNTFSDPRKTDFRRAQTLGFKCGIPTQAAEPPAIGQTVHMATTMRKPLEEEFPELDFTMTYGSRGRAKTPPTTAPLEVPDKKVLTFSAYFMETENFVTDEKRVRFVRLTYYIDDGTLSVWEPRVANSGLTHGTLVRRQRVPSDTSTVGNARFYSEDDLVVGKDLTIYAVVYRLYDCDLFTRDYYKALGKEQPPSEEPPADAHKERRRAVEKPERTVAPADPDKYALKKFLENDRRVLRFYAIWDNTRELFGEKLRFTLCYYLVDDTADIREMRSPNDGRDIFTLFLRRQRLPKSGGVGFYTDAELGIGATVDILGREFMLYDADKFTKDYYASKYGITDWPKVDVGAGSADTELSPATPERAMSASARAPLVPRPPKQDVRKLLENHGKMLRFRATIEAPQGARGEEFRGRQFVIAYWLADDTISVVEIPDKNGIPGGHFLERRRVRNPQRANSAGRHGTSPSSLGSIGDTAALPEEFYSASDCYLGAKLDLDGWRFVLIDAAEYALQYMESRPDEFPLSDIDWVMDRLSRTLADKRVNVEAALRARDTEKCGHVTPQQFRDVLTGAGASLVEQEFITLTRRFDINAIGSVSYLEFLALFKVYAPPS